ncbi:MAG TPA: RNA-binding cell elongation regulator Jag/EloR [Bacilli bacterium]
MKKVIATGKTIDEAVKSGLEQLKTTANRVKIHIVDQPTKGLFGLLGTKEAKVELELIPDPVDEAIAFLEQIFDAMRVPVRIERSIGGDGIKLNLTGPDLGLLIGRRGQTLDALQFLVNIIANKFSDTHVRILLDAENFRDRRRKTLEDLSIRLAGRVVRTRKEIVLEPMSPQERKVIHTVLQEHPKVRTYSKGEEPNRRVVITLK